VDERKAQYRAWKDEKFGKSAFRQSIDQGGSSSRRGGGGLGSMGVGGQSREASHSRIQRADNSGAVTSSYSQRGISSEEYFAQVFHKRCSESFVIRMPLWRQTWQGLDKLAIATQKSPKSSKKKKKKKKKKKRKQKRVDGSGSDASDSEEGGQGRGCDTVSDSSGTESSGAERRRRKKKKKKKKREREREKKARERKETERSIRRPAAQQSWSSYQQ
jgi:hypothetical protein